jgi:hypothetical protein
MNCLTTVRKIFSFCVNLSLFEVSNDRETFSVNLTNSWRIFSLFSAVDWVPNDKFKDKK